MNCNIQYVNDIDILIQAYNHYVFFVSKKKYNQEKNNPGGLRQEAERKKISHARGRVSIFFT
jgi:hypothetical protein